MGANMTYGDESNGCVPPERTSERVSNPSARPEIATVRRYEGFRIEKSFFRFSFAFDALA